MICVEEDRPVLHNARHILPELFWRSAPAFRGGGGQLRNFPAGGEAPPPQPEPQQSSVAAEPAASWLDPKGI